MNSFHYPEDRAELFEGDDNMEQMAYEWVSDIIEQRGVDYVLARIPTKLRTQLLELSKALLNP